MDGILKLLNAICNNNNISVGSNFSALNVQNIQLTQLPTNGILPTNSSNNASNAISNILNNTLNNSLNDQNKFTNAGLAIAAAIMTSSSLSSSSNAKSSDSYAIINCPNGAVNCSSSLTSSNNSNNLNLAKSSLIGLQSELNSYSSFENNQIYQILSACKCLFVSHRKISIYMHLKQLDEQNDGHIENDEDNLSELDECQMSESNLRDDIAESSVRLDPTIKLMLSDIRIPLSWKWSDHQRALKNSDTSSISKYVTFAVIYLGNMVYDTQLITNVDASMTEICFNETFVL